MSTNQDQLIGALSTSKIYQDYERAFAASTGLPVALRSVDSWHLPHRRRRNENPFCALMAEKSRACAACLQVQQQLSESAVREPKTVTCQHGLSDSAVPVRLGEQLIGYLQTGQIFHRKPSAAQFARTTRLIADWGLEIDALALKEAYFSTRVLSPKQYESMLRLLGIFAQHLSMVSNQVVVRRSPWATRGSKPETRSRNQRWPSVRALWFRISDFLSGAIKNVGHKCAGTRKAPASWRFVDRRFQSHPFLSRGLTAERVTHIISKS
jgi:ligand-binding sensor protein